MAKDKDLNASVLAFERKLSNSDAQMHAGLWDKRDESSAWEPIKLIEKSVRGTISNRLKAGKADPAKLDAEVSKPNLQTVDAAALPFNCDTLKVSFTLRVLSGLDKPTACNNPDYQAKLAGIIEGYQGEFGFKSLAVRYAENIANARFLWRNRLGAEACEVQVEAGDQKWTFNSFDYSLRDFKESAELQGLADLIAEGLSNEDKFVFLKVSAFVKLGEGQEVYPSQELVMDKEKGTKSKILYAVSDCAALHSQKIGNALRTIDTWFNQADEVGPIAVEPYGSVTSRGKAYRVPKEKTDFYTTLDQWVVKDVVPSTEQQHYFIANLIRGGVFGKAD